MKRFMTPVSSRRLPEKTGALLVSALLLAGCATNPVSGNPEVVFSSREDELAIGKQAAQQVEEQMGLMPDSPRTRYVEELGSKLAAHSPRQDIEYQFHIIDMKEPNAFALPGGYIYVSRGLMLLANGEDALAGAVGHEIGHAAARHSVQRQTRAAPLAILSGVTAGVIGIVSPRLGRGVGSVTGFANSAVLAPYGRNQEREADRVGQDIASASGYAASGLTQLLDSLGKEQALHEDAPSGLRFLATHPSSEERVANTLAYAAELQPTAAATLSPTQKDFYDRLDGLVVGNRAAGGVFVDEFQFLHPDLDFKLRFPEGWTVQNGHSVVGAVAPDEDSAVLLQVDKPSKDPVASGRAFLAEARLKLGDPEAIRVGGLEAARVIGTQGGRGVVLTWVLHKDTMFQIISVGPEKRFGPLKKIFITVADSFAPLAAADRDKIFETRVRIFGAKRGESLEQLAERVDGEGEIDFMAVVNGIADASAPLEAGKLIKVPISEHYEAAR